MKFFALGRLGSTILDMPVKDLWTIIKLSPPLDGWCRGESLTEMVKRIAKLESRDYNLVLQEVQSIRTAIDSRALPERPIY